MKIYVADAFTRTCYTGNPAGVVLLDKGQAFPADDDMRKIAAEMKHSEKALSAFRQRRPFNYAILHRKEKLTFADMRPLPHLQYCAIKRDCLQAVMPFKPVRGLSPYR